METSVARCFERKGERISDGVREREEKGRKAAKNMFSLLAGEVEIGKGTKEGQLDNSVAKS